MSIAGHRVFAQKFGFRLGFCSKVRFSLGFLLKSWVFAWVFAQKLGFRLGFCSKVGFSLRFLLKSWVFALVFA